MEKTKCQDIEPLLDGLYDGELTAGELVTTQTHVGQCADCQTKLAEIEMVSQSLSKLPRLSAKKDYAEDILAKAKQHQAQRVISDNVVSFPRKKLWASLAAGFVIVGIGYALLSAHEPQPRLSTNPSQKIEKISQPALPVEKEKTGTISRQPKRKIIFKTRLAEGKIEKAKDEVLAYDDGYQPNLMEGMGIQTDEDGLYALKM